MDGPMAVCGRCAGIYYGTLISTVGSFHFKKFYFDLQKSNRWLWLSLLPVMIDFGLEKTGLISTGIVIHIMTGMIPGWTAGVYIITGIVDWIVPEHINN